MNTKHLQALGRLLTPALLALAGCESSPSAVMSQEDGGTDAGQDEGEAGAPIRTATTRALLATPVNNLLLDPFVTADTSLGHFVGVLLPVVGTDYQQITPVRSFVSQSPAGVAGPVVVIPRLSAYGSPSTTGGRIIAPFPGGTAPFGAQVWVSASDGTGMPVPFAAGGKGLAVSLLPNDTSMPAYPLSVSGAPVEIAGREWVLLALATPVPMTQGGWFSIAVEDVDASFQLQAPQVTPAAGGGPGPRTTPRTEGDRVAQAAYTELTHRAHKKTR